MNALPARDRPRRSALFVPGNNERFLAGAGRRGADAVILDLEDSLAQDDRATARALVRDALATVDFGGAERIVRINPFPAGRDDIDVILPGRPDTLLLPKVESPDGVREVESFIAQGAARHGCGRSIGFVAGIETALGVERAFEIACASDAVAALMVGVEDYTADMGVEKTRRGRESLYARMRIVNAARAAGLRALDAVYGDFADLEGLRAWARASRGLGFSGMGCIHPAQIPAVNEVFSPSRSEIERASRVLAAYADAVRAGRGVAVVDGMMVDRPVARRAERVLAEAAALGLLSR